jgi:hypothetical protein
LTATTAGPEFEKAMRPILEAAGPLPQGRLKLAIGASSHSNRHKKPSCQRIKCACSNCGYTVHTTRKWLGLAGAPLCPKHGQMDAEKMQSPTTCRRITPSALVRVGHEFVSHRRLNLSPLGLSYKLRSSRLAGTLTFIGPFNLYSHYYR